MEHSAIGNHDVMNDRMQNGFAIYGPPSEAGGGAGGEAGTFSNEGDTVMKQV